MTGAIAGLVRRPEDEDDIIFSYLRLHLLQVGDENDLGQRLNIFVRCPIVNPSRWPDFRQDINALARSAALSPKDTHGSSGDRELVKGDWEMFFSLMRPPLLLCTLMHRA